ALDGNDAFASATDSTKTFFIFSDTLFGTASKDGKKALREAMPNHTSAILEGNKPDTSRRSFVWGKGGSCTLDMHDLDDNEKKNLVGAPKWFTDGLVLGDKLYLFCYTPIGLSNDSVDMAIFPIVGGSVDYARCSLIERIPELCMLNEKGELAVDYGYAVHVNTKEARAPDPDGYIYIYGGGRDYSGYVSRIRAEDFPDFSKLRYYDGSGWSARQADAAVVIRGISREYSVTPIPAGPKAGKYIAVFMDRCISGDIAYAIADTPYGPFGEVVRFYRAPEAGQIILDAAGKEDTVFTYNAKAHPHLSKGCRLLISYNTNVWNGSNTPYCYHPRFIRLDLETI
ncbi:MAG: DUF4185 domain-containing protein, partial [Clostridia bacterium]|nr:DUF4185 domain-containing protein [Clostridia bacterium]